VTGAAPESEWTIGWRIVASMAIANATGIALMFYTFSMFLIPIAEELKLSRGQIGLVQALIITAAIGAPVLGRMADTLGFRRVFIGATLAFTAVEIGLAVWVDSMASLALAIALAGLIGGGATAVLLTRPISAHFRQHRGKALGLVAAGSSISTIFIPPILHAVIAEEGWRTGFVALALIASLVGLPLVLALLPRGPRLPALAPSAAGSGHPGPRS